MDRLMEYYAGDDFAAGVWKGKYALKKNKEVVEDSPNDMHWRMAKELARAEVQYKIATPEQKAALSDFGAHLTGIKFDENFIFSYLHRFKYIIPQGSIMSMLGNPYVIGSLSNCFVVPSPYDSYGGIFKTDQEIAQLEKRRGGVGTNLNTLRPDDAPVMNAAGTSTGAHSFMDRYSNTTREVAQNGRRGALMLLMSVLHPDIFKFVTKKSDLTKVTGANVSAQLTNKFMDAVNGDEDFYCRFPIDLEFDVHPDMNLEYNKVTTVKTAGGNDVYIMKIKAKELFDLIVEMAWTNGEPGIAFMDNVVSWSPEGVYQQFMAIASNPCGEQWMQAYDACRLLATNLFSFVRNPWTILAELDYEKMYEVFYIQQRLADDIVDLEIEYVQRISDKIEADIQKEVAKKQFTEQVIREMYQAEVSLWENIKETATASRRTGCGFTGLADMLAALGLKYDSNEALAVVRHVMRTKMRAELDCTIDMAITRGTFTGYNYQLEFEIKVEPRQTPRVTKGKNPFFQMLVEEFPDQATRMMRWGRRNVNWSTVAPTGTVSIVAILETYANLSAGIEPVFFPYYFRNKKVNPSDKGVRVDMIDQNGDHWQTYPVVMGGFKEWFVWSNTTNTLNERSRAEEILEGLTKDQMDEFFKISPYYGSTANDISWEKRVEMQAIVQRYTTNAISSTINLPNDVSKETVAGIYKAAHAAGLKGITVYRDGCRTGVMNVEAKKEDGMVYKDAVKRPKTITADLNIATVKGVKYGVIVGLVDEKPYEIFAFNLPGDIKKECVGTTTKVKKGVYSFECKEGIIRNLQDAAVHNDEIVLTRLVSGMLRHGIKPQYVMEQIEKCDLEIVSFGKAVSRILKKYVSDEDMVKRNTCKSCGSNNVRMQEGCLTCMDCGGSKCG